MQQSNVTPNETASTPQSNIATSDTWTTSQPQVQHVAPKPVQQTKYCKDCGSAIALQAEICPKCGVRQVAAQVQSTGPKKSRTVAALLAFFLGGAGGHRFYYGEVGMGFLYLIFSWTFIPAFIAIFEFIGLLMMSDEEFDRRHNAS